MCSLLEAQRIDVEFLGFAKIAHVKVNMPDHGACRQSRPGQAFRSSQQSIHIYRVRGHYHIPVRFMLPCIPRPVAVQLNSVIIRILNVQRLTNQMIALTDVNPGINQIAQHQSQTGTVRHQNGKVIEPRCRIAPEHPRAVNLPQHQEHMLAIRCHLHFAPALAQHLQSYHILIKSERTIQIAYPKLHPSNFQCLRQCCCCCHINPS
ncbi:hypothetical protein D3C74_299080 [compost metagenome]